MPGRRSTPELTSTMSGRTRATAAATVSGVSPPASAITPPASRVRRGFAQAAEILGAGQTHHAPDAQPVGPKPRRVLAPVSAVKLGAGQPGRAGDAENLVDRLFAEDAENRDHACGLRYLGGRLDGDMPRTTSKNDAQVVRPRGHGHSRVLGARQATDLGTHGPAAIGHGG
jgi:hypothetical protein